MLLELDRLVNPDNAQKVSCMHVISFVGLPLMKLAGVSVSAIYVSALLLTVLSNSSLFQEKVLTGGHGLMVQGYDPVIKALSSDIDIRLNHRYASTFSE